jgi:hypothetical protein
MTLFTIPFVYFLGVHGTSLAFALVSLGCLTATLFMIDDGLHLAWSANQKALVGFLFLSCAPMGWVLSAGQTGAILACLITASWYLTRKGWFVAAGIAVGLAASLKLFPALLFVYFLVRQRRVFAAALVTALFVNLATAMCLGVESYTQYYETIRYVAERDAYAISNCSLRRALHELSQVVSLSFVGSSWFYLGTVGCLVCLFTAAMALRPPPRLSSPESDYEMGLFVVGMCLFSPICWSHYFVILVLPFALLGSQILRPGITPWSVVAFVCLVAVLVIPDQCYEYLVPLIAHRFSGRAGLMVSIIPCTMLIWMAAWIARRHAAPVQRDDLRHSEDSRLLRSPQSSAVLP